MTVPDERMRAIEEAENFLCALLDPNKTPKVPKEIRKWACRVLRHYPTKHDVKAYLRHL